MKNIYLLNFDAYHSQLYTCLIAERIGNTPIVKVRRQFGDLPFWKYFSYRLFSQIGRYFQRQANIIEYEIHVTHGMEKDVIWRKQTNGMYEPYDKIADVSMPHLQRKTPPTKKKIVNKMFVREA